MRFQIATRVVGAVTVLALCAHLAGQDEHFHATGGHTDSVANRVEQAANLVAWELHNHHRGHHDFRVVYRETKEMWAVARHCHDLLHNNISNDRLKRNVRELDELFHHLEEHLVTWQMGYSARVNGQWHDYVLHDHEHGHGFGGEHRLLALMADLERSLHHLMEDVGVQPGEYIKNPSPSVSTAPNNILPPN